jgi:antitoxin component YwqK of YwqJK toxin-antitoxin module
VKYEKNKFSKSIKAGKKDGQCLEYFSDGQLYKKENYENGIKTGKCLEYYSEL